MTETPPPPVQPTPAAAVPATRSRRRLVIGLVAALVAAVLIVIGVLVALGVVNAHPDVRYTSAAEHYSVVAPGKPTRETVEIAGGAIPITATHWTDGDRYYSVSSNIGSIPPSQRGLFLYDALKEGLKYAPGVTASSLKSLVDKQVFLTKPELIKLSGATATLFTVPVKGASTPFHVVFAGHGELVYMVVYSADSHDKDFLKSFKFVG